MPGLVPGIHALAAHDERKAWMAGPSPAEGSKIEHFSACATARRRDKPGHDVARERFVEENPIEETPGKGP